MSALLDRFRDRETLPLHAEALRSEVRAFLAEQLVGMPPSRRARSWMGFDADFSRAMAARGWVGLTLPAAYGGAGLDAFCRFVVVEELLIAGAPVAAHWIADRQSGPLLLKYGTTEQQHRYLPRICAGDAFFCIGMSEPNAGSDLASVTTRAEPTADGWALSGQKIWTTNAHHCDYMIALVRSSGAAGDRQAGLSQFIIDLRLPGVTVRPIRDLTGDAHFSEVFFDDVRLAPDALVGREGAGWEQVNSELAFERSGPERIYSSIVLLDRWVETVRASGDATPHAAMIGRLIAHLYVLRQMSISVTARIARGESPVIEAAMVKDLGTTFEQEIPDLIEAALGATPSRSLDAELLRTASYVAQTAPSFSLRGGTREILRGMIARGLELR